MNSKKIPVGVMILVVVLMLGLLGAILDRVHKDVPVRPGDNYFIPVDELDVLVLSAQKGSLTAMRKLIYYFEQYEGNVDKARYWSIKAREHGDENEIRLYIFETLYDIRYSGMNLLERHKALADIHVVAKRLLKEHENLKNEELLLEVESEQVRLDKFD